MLQGLFGIFVLFKTKPRLAWNSCSRADLELETVLLSQPAECQDYLHASPSLAFAESFEDIKLKCFVLFSTQITRKFRLNSEGKLEQTVSMATTTQPMTQHLHITYKKVTP